MGTRPSSGLARALFAGAVLLASSGCLTLLDIDEDPYGLESDGGDAGAAGGGGEGGTQQQDASVHGDDDGSSSASDAGPPIGDSAPPGPDGCDARGWHRDCAFGDGGFLTVASRVADGGPLTDLDDAGNVYVAAMSGSLTDPNRMFLASVASDGGMTSTSVELQSSILDLRVLPDGELSVLTEYEDQILVQRFDAGVSVQQAELFELSGSPPGKVTPLNLLDVEGSVWAVALASAEYQAVSSVSSPAIGAFDMGAGSATFASTQGNLVAAKALAIDPNAWFVSGTDQSFEMAPLDGGSPPTDGTCGAYAMPFAELTAIDGFAVGLAPTAEGFALLALGSCSLLASVPVANETDVQLGTGLHLARGAVAGADSVAVTALLRGQVSRLFAGHLPITVDAGTVNGGPPFDLSLAPGSTAGIILGPDVVAIGPPVLSGGLLYVPLVVMTSPADGDAGADAADASISLSLVLLRLAYQP